MEETLRRGNFRGILLLVSLSWAVIVDLTPADQRPYIGSSENNTVMELIVGHNGLSRLFNPRGGQNAPANNLNGPDAQPPAPPMPGVNPGGQNIQPPPPRALEACRALSAGEACSFTQPNGNTIHGACIFPPGMNQLACAPQERLPQNAPGAPVGQDPQPRPGFNPPPGMMGDGPNASPNPAAGGTPFSRETGSPGLLRFFLPPLSKQMSWLLPFALIALTGLLFAARPRLPLQAEHQAFVLWGGWLLTCLVFFSAVEGIFHAYYAIMLAPALGAAVGAGMTLFWRWQAARPGTNAGLLLAAGLTVAFQIFTAAQYGVKSLFVYAPVLLLAGGAVLLSVKSLRPVAYLMVLTALVFLPLLWTGMTVFDPSPDVSLPTAFDGGQAQQTPPQPAPAPNPPNPADEALTAFLQANTQDVEYLAAVPNAHLGAPLVLATGRPVLYMGGFGGGDPVIDAAGLAEMVANGELRYVLFGGERNKPEIAEWLQTSCRVVPEFSQRAQAGQPPSPSQPLTLYRCGP